MPDCLAPRPLPRRQALPLAAFPDPRAEAPVGLEGAFPSAEGVSRRNEGGLLPPNVFACSSSKVQVDVNASKLEPKRSGDSRGAARSSEDLPRGSRV